MRTALYRHQDAAGKLLYVGITGSIGARTNSHLRSSRWSDQIANISVQWFGTRDEALTAEAIAIREEKPPFNKQLVAPKQFPRPEIDPGLAEAELVAKIEAYCARNNMGTTMFGKRVLKDANLVANLRAGRELRTKTRIAILAALEMEPA